ncbi:hypothetical protein N7486_001012 [Penicillium sp. IBT 16267x]|nr:hypothetical protein N7486_001012 [Penicillium sp. IBT 16267x]
MIRKLQRENYLSFRPKDGKPKAYQSQMLSWLEETVWDDPCQSSFKNGMKDGALHACHAGSRLNYFKLLRRHHYENFQWESRCSELGLDFPWLNNGFLSHELSPDEEADPTWYLNQGYATLTKFMGENKV